LAKAPALWPWSSVGAHHSGRDDALARVAPVLARVERFAALLEPSPDEQPRLAAFEAGGGAGRPMGSPQFIEKAERSWGERCSRADAAEAESAEKLM